MSKNEHGSAGARVRILKDLFHHVSREQACALVGILFENRIVLTAETWNPTSCTKQRRTIELQPLDPQAASILVADVFDLDCDRLFLHFQRDWVSLKDSVVAKESKAAIGSHQLVAHLEQGAPLV